MTVDHLGFHEVWKGDEKGETPWGQLFLYENFITGKLFLEVLHLLCVLALFEKTIELLDEVFIS